MVQNNRLILCTFYEKYGRLFEGDLFYLDSLLPLCRKLILIVNGEINDYSKIKIQKRGIQIIVRANKGLDFGAWQEALLCLGWKEIHGYNEILLTNLTCYGPIYSFQNLFDEMGTRDCDFWGINRHPAMPNIKLIQTDPSTTIQEHIQSYFIVFRKKVILSGEFKNFWENLKQASNYEEEVAYHENRLTYFLESSGFKSDTYMPFEKYSRTKGNASILEGYNQLVENKNPLIKKKVFSLEQKYCLQYGNWGQCSKILDYLEKETEYPISHIIKEMIATLPMSIIQTNLHLTFPISNKNRVPYNNSKRLNLGLVYFSYYDDQVQYMSNFLKNFPKSTHVYLISAKNNLLNAYEKFLKINGFENIEKRTVLPRGRTESAYLVGAFDVYDKHEYVCYLHDKKSSQAGYLLGTAYRDHNIENLVSTKEYILNTIDIFNDDPFLGMLSPPTFPLALGSEMGDPKNRELLQQLFNEYKIKIPFDNIPVAPYGTMFWIRGKAFDVLKRKKLSFDDFPKEPVPTDGTILHAYERFYPALVQEAGYYCGWCGTLNIMSQYFDLAFYVWREYKKSNSSGIRIALYNLLREVKRKCFPKCYFPRLVSSIRRILDV